MDPIEYPDFRTQLKETGQYITVVRGVSMFPMLRNTKDPILIVPAVGELKPYDIAVYNKTDRYIVHRVLEVKSDHYVIRGDNCDNVEYVPKNLVEGKVEGFWRFGKYIPTGSRWQRIYAHLWVTINPLVRLTHNTRQILFALKSKLVRAW